MTNKQAYAGLLERLNKRAHRFGTYGAKLDIEAAEAISSLLKALEAIAGMLSGYAGQPNHMGDVFKIADAALSGEKQ